MGEWANGRMGEWATGRMGEWANGRMGESGLNHYFFVAFLLILYTLKTLQNKIDLITIEFVSGSKILEIVAQTFLI